MKAEANEEKVQEIVSQHLHELSNKGEYDLSLNAKEYEKYIQKLESEVRNHISVSYKSGIAYSHNLIYFGSL